jgi:hypothetical protein
VCAFFITSALAQNFQSDLHNNTRIERDVQNLISMHVAGGDYSYEDNLHIYFWEGATTGYDAELESIKWYSINPDATMIWSIATDETELAINAMPLSCLYSGITSIPIHFECGYDAEYTFTFSGLDTFEYPTEFWLQDITRDGDWLSITEENNTFTFQGYVTDANMDRFVMHFMDPTGVEKIPFDIDPVNEIHIRASANNAIIETEYPELIMGVEIFDLVGNEIYKGRPVQNKTQKIYVSHQHGYYFVKVVTHNHVFTKKIFIGQ